MKLFSTYQSSTISHPGVGNTFGLAVQNELHLALSSGKSSNMTGLLMHAFSMHITQFMVEDFGISDQYNATYVGLLASTFFFCQFATSILWGAASDKYGRRPCLLWGVALNGLAMMQFGFASSFGLAVLGRALAGGLSGNVAISKSYLGEVTVGNRSAKGFGLLGFVWGIGSVSAPIAGGYLSNPTTRYPSVFPPASFPVLVDFPYLLPSALSAVVAALALVVGYFFLPETPAFLRRQAELATQLQAAAAPGPMQVLLECATKALHYMKRQPASQQYQPVATSQALPGAAPQVSAGALPGSAQLELAPARQERGPAGAQEHLDTATVQPAYSAVAPPDTPQLHLGGTVLPRPRRQCCSCATWLLSRGISDATAMCIASYACVATAQVLFDEMMPIFAKTKGGSGGLSFDSGQVGLVLTIQGVALILYQPLLFPILVQRIGAVRLFTASSLMLVPVFFLFPCLSLAYDAPAVLWPALAAAVVIKACLMANMFTGILMLTIRSARGENLGKVNGVSQASSAAVRSVSPFVGGVLFSLSTAVPGRLHAMIPYALPTVVLLGCAWLSNQIPPSLNFDEDPPASAQPLEAEADTKQLLQPDKTTTDDSPVGSDLPLPQYIQPAGTDPDSDQAQQQPREMV